MSTTFALPEHDARCETVCAQVRARPAGKKLTVRKNTHGHSVRNLSYKADCHPIDVSGLDQVLQIDVQRRLAIVEGQVTMDQLCRATLPLGLVPAVVPEFPLFTVAGLINGQGVQSSSHRYGVFTDSVREIEIITGDGRRMTTSREQDPELVAALVAAYGTLGFVSAATVALVPAKQWVRTTMRRFRTLEPYLAAFGEAVGRAAFFEGVIFGPDQYVIIEGDFVDDPAGEAVYDPFEIGAPYYYQRVKARSQAADTSVDVIETLRYLQRSARGLWWMAECQVGLPFVTNSTWGRKAIDKETAKVVARTGFAGGGFTTEERERNVVNQDMGMWLPRLGDGIRHVQRELGVYPLWNCPILHPKGNGVSNVIVDIGIYGEPTVPNYRHRRKMRDLQLFVDHASLWGVSYLTRQELVDRGVYDRPRYERARALASANDAFLDIEEKIVWIDPGQGDGPVKHPLWRLERSYGKRWRLKFAGAGLAFAAVLFGLAQLL